MTCNFAPLLSEPLDVPPADNSALPGIGFRICYAQQLWIEGTRAMQDEWYGDKRDVVKWSSLVHLAQREKIQHILHVAMYRSNTYPALDTAQGPVELPIEVVQHFCDLNDVQRLATATGLRVEVCKEEFCDRSDYFDRVCKRIRSYDCTPLVVFLDPDTGLTPKKPGLEHVTLCEVAVVFKALRSRDLLVCYQHASRVKDWQDLKRREFACALGLETSKVEVFKSDFAWNVAMLAVKKARCE